MERVKGIEPSSQAWEARVLPLNHTRSLNLLLYFLTFSATDPQEKNALLVDFFSPSPLLFAFLYRVLLK